ncbi:MAG: hypothetical protein V3V01_13960 [Acidimicrobiales bacterium]
MRSLIVVLALVAGLGLALASPAGAGAGSSDELAQPPGPSCDAPIFQSTHSYTDEGFASNPLRFGTAGSLLRSFTLPDVSFEPGTIYISEVITFDGHVERELELQPNEQVRIEFRLDGETVATSSLTEDLIDGVTSAWNVMSIGDLELPQGASEVVIVHHGSNGATIANSLSVTSICTRFTPQIAPETTTVPATTTPPEATVAPPATTIAPAPATTATPSPSTSQAPQEPATTTTVPGPPELAITGPADSTGDLALIGFALLGLGTTLFVSTRRQGD